MANMPKYSGKTLKNLLLQNQKADDVETWYAALSAWVLTRLFKWWPWDDLDVFKSLMLLYGEKGKTMDFSETIVVYDLKLATDDRCDKMFLLTSKFRPQGVVSSCLGFIYMYKILTKYV